MHITANQSVVIEALYHAQIGAVDIDGIVHHTLVQAVDRNNLALAAREVCSIGLGCKIAVTTLAKRNTETVESEILAHLGKQTHTLGIKNY